VLVTVYRLARSTKSYSRLGMTGDRKVSKEEITQYII